jgi:hypothetical protein
VTREELVTWAAQNGLTVVPTVKWQALCAEVAVVIAAQSDLDADLAALLGR